MRMRTLAQILLAAGGLSPSVRDVSGQQRAAASASRVIARTMLGETAIEVRAWAPGVVLVGMAAGEGELTLDLVAGDVRRFSSAVSSRLTRRRGAKPAGWSERVEEPGVGAGSMSLSLAVAAKESTYTLFAADETLVSVRQRLSRAEVGVFARHLHAAARAALPPLAPTRRPTARKPNVASKRP
jgi:hypothetical protein